MLNEQDFKHLVKNAPLFAIDLVVLNEQNQLLLGKRNNPPAKGYWFVLGGRVFKNESLEFAFERICQTELGLVYPYKQAKLLGLYDHFYQDSVFGNETDTHYINAPYRINLHHTQGLNLPMEQHHAYRWLSLDKLEHDVTVHPNSKIFMEAIKTAQGLNQHD